MKVIVDFCVIPMVGTASLTPYIAECQQILEEAGLSYQLHAFGTNIEGEWDQVMMAVKRCHMRIHEMGAGRISSTLKLGTRVDLLQSMADKVRSVSEFRNRQRESSDDND